MCVSTAMAKCVISAGSALAPDLHEKYPSRSACYLIYLFFLSVCSSRLHLVLVRLPASSVVYAPTALSPTHTHSHTRATLDGHWLHLSNAFNHPFGRDASHRSGQTKNIFLFSILSLSALLSSARQSDPSSIAFNEEKNASGKKAHFTFIII